MLWKAEDAKPGDDLPVRLPLGAQRLFRSGAEARAERCRRCRLLLFLPSCATACGVSPNQIPGSCWANTNTRSATFVVSKQRATSQQNPGGLSKPICCRVPQAVPGTGLERPTGDSNKPSLRELEPSRGNLLSCLCCQRNYRKLHPQTVTDTAVLGLRQWGEGFSPSRAAGGCERSLQHQKHPRALGAGR